MARVAIRAHFSLNPPIGIGPDVGRLHACVPILAVGDGVSSDTWRTHDWREFWLRLVWVVHERHLTELASRVLDEPPRRLQFFDERDGLLRQLYPQARTVCLWRVVVVPVFSHGRDAESLTGRRRPKHVWSIGKI